MKPISPLMRNVCNPYIESLVRSFDHGSIQRSSLGRSENFGSSLFGARSLHFLPGSEVWAALCNPWATVLVHPGLQTQGPAGGSGDDLLGWRLRA